MNLQENKKSAGLSFTEQHRLSEIPEEIERLELEIKKLEEFLSIDDLYQSDQKKFDKASSALAERKLKMDKIMEEWLLLEDKQNYGQLSWKFPNSAVLKLLAKFINPSIVNNPQ